MNAPEGAHISYSAHVQNIGWQKEVTDGQEAGTDGQALRIEALKINLVGMPGYSIQYQAHVQYLGWQNWVSDGNIAGTMGQSLRVEAIRIRLVKGVQPVTLNKTSDTLNVGESDTLSATVSPDAGANKNIVWKSSDTAVATVDSNGKVTGVSGGTATITASTEDGKTASCTVTVNKINVSSITLNKPPDTLSSGGSYTLTATISPTNASDKNVTWTSSNTGVATVDSSGKVTGVSGGTATITATTEDGGQSASCKVTVDKINVSSITLNKTPDTLNPGGSYTLTATISPTNASDQKVTWTSSDETAVKVDINGKITAVGDGTAVITATTEDGGKTASCGVGVFSSTDTNYNDALNKAKKTVLPSIITNGMSTVDKELAIHDYIVANTDYNTAVYNHDSNVSDNVYTAYGVLVDKSAVCEGYAKAFKLMCDLECIPCRVIKDLDPLDHAWNEVKLDDGNYYQVDCTWDDPVTRSKSDNKYVPGDFVEHKYFNLSDRQMFGNHPIDKKEWASYNNPLCPIDSTEFYSVANASHDANLVYTIYKNKLCSTDSTGTMNVISQDDAKYINYYNGYVYYINDNDNDNGIYRVGSDGSNKMKISKSSEKVDKMYIYNGAAYYIDLNDFSIHKLLLDGSYNSDTIIDYTWNTNYFINGDFLYYDDAANSHYLNKRNLITLEDRKILSVTDINLQIYGDYIFYKNASSIYRTDLDGQNSTLFLSGISDKDFIDAAINHIYYKVSNIWHKINLDGSGMIKLSF